MKPLHHQLSKLSKVHRSHEHPLLHHLHAKYHISRKTLFYVKEYGQHSNIMRVIVKESTGMLLLATLITLFGGIALEEIKTTFVAVMPLVILLPALNSLIGSYGTIISSRLTTLLHEGYIQKNALLNREMQKLILQIMLIAAITAIVAAAASLAISTFAGFPWDLTLAVRIFLIALFDTLILVALLTFIATTLGLALYKKKEDPNNILIPLTTSIADVGNIVIMALLIAAFF